MAIELLGGKSFWDCGAERLQALAEQIGFEASDVGVAEEVFRCLLAPWADLPVGATPRYASDISDDHTPFEFSLAIDGGRPELRFLVEAQASQPSLSANWEKAREVNTALEARYGISLDRLRAIESFYTPMDRSCRFGAWHAVCFRKGSKPDFKIYLNPQAQGKKHAFVIVAATMSRLGFDEAYSVLAERPEDEIKYFSLDLAENAGARVKVYTAHHGAYSPDLEHALSYARDYVPGEATRFCRAMTGGDGPFGGRPVLTCLSFVDGNPMPTTGTLHIPVRAYADNDLVARDRIIEYLDQESASVYSKALEAFANRPLGDGVGMQAYASLRQQSGARRVTVYLATELYDVAVPQSVPLPSIAPPSMAPVSGYVSKVPQSVRGTHLRRVAG